MSNLEHLLLKYLILAFFVSVHGNWSKIIFTQDIRPLTVKLGQRVGMTQGFKMMAEAITQNLLSIINHFFTLHTA